MSAAQHMYNSRLRLPYLLLLSALTLVFWSLPCFSEPSPGKNSDKPDKQTIRSAFDSLTARAVLASGTSEIAVSWSYVNRWDFPLMVERFEESCGCLHGSLDQQPVAPGKTGTIRGTFTPGAYRGILRKSLHVRFVGYDEPVELVAEVHIPSSVELSSQELEWPRGGPLEPRTVDVKAGTSASFRITGLTGVSKEQFIITEEVVEAGRHYRLTITPAEGAVGGVVGAKCLQVRTDSPDPRDQLLAVFLSVGAPPAASTVPLKPTTSGS